MRQALTELEEWDFKTIKFLKREKSPTIPEMKEFWAERCAVSVDIIGCIPICEVLFNIYSSFSNRNLFDFIVEMSPSQRFWFNIDESVIDYWEICLLVAMSKIRNMAADDLPGYRLWTNRSRKF